jgi:GNAT superfamily N-acetyltransferase
MQRSVVPYDPSEKSGLRDFQRDYFGADSRQCDDAFCDWLFECNPHRAPDSPVRWLCKRDGLVVGQQASIPVVLKAGGIEYRASWGIDLMVHAQWRLKGVAPALAAAHEHSADILLGLGMSPAAYRAFSRAGWADMGCLPFVVRPLDARACAHALENREWLAKLAPDVLVRGSARIASNLLRGLSRCSLEPIPAFDERVDAVWTSSARDYHVLVKRDYTSLRWRFDQFPDPSCYERYYLTRASRVLGYAVVRMDSWRGHRIARLVDYLTERRYITPLFALLIDAMRAKGTAAVFIEQLHPNSAGVLTLLGCFRVGAVTRFILKTKPTAARFAELLTQAHSWLVTRADSDSDIPAIALPAGYQPQLAPKGNATGDNRDRPFS